MSETGSFSEEERSDHSEIVRKGGEAARRLTFSEENSRQARYILDKLAFRREQLGTSRPLGRIGLIGGVGVNRTEIEMRPEYWRREEEQSES